MTLYSDSGMADCLNTETRVLRDPLYRSNERLKGARGKAAHDLSPRQHTMQDWEHPQTSGSSDAVTSLVSENPQICEMQQALLKFEAGLGFQEPPTRDRAFFSALRCLLSEVLTERNPEEQDTKLRAVCKWFLRYRPRGSSMDSSTSAVLATSLSIPTPSRAEKLHNQPQQGGSHAPFNLQGTKHEFNSLFSRGQGGKDAVQPKGTLALLREAMGSKQAGPAGTREAPKPQRADIPMVCQPASAMKSSSPSTTQQGRSGKKGFPGYKPYDDEDENKGPAGPNFMPRDRMRGVSEPMATKTEGGNGRASSWFQGPFKSGSTAAPVTAQMPRPKYRPQADPHEASLRSKWSNMAEATARSDAHVDVQLQAWSRDRAHLEGELVRRQETRYGSPTRQQGLADESLQGDGYISAYHGVTAESAAALAAGLDKSDHHQQGVAVPHSIAATAREVRAAAQAEYARDMQKLQDLGMIGATQETMQKALEPVADKPYLQVLSALPKPGENLPSRPSSVPAKTKKRPTTSKKSRRP